MGTDISWRDRPVYTLSCFMIRDTGIKHKPYDPLGPKHDFTLLTSCFIKYLKAKNLYYR